MNVNRKVGGVLILLFVMLIASFNITNIIRQQPRQSTVKGEKSLQELHLTGATLLADNQITNILNSFKSQSIKQLAAGDHHTLLLTSDGEVWSWGGNDEGETGLNSSQKLISEATKIETLPPITKLATFENHSLALDANGEVWSWGNNRNSQLGTGDQQNLYTPKKIHGLPPIEQIATGSRVSLALDTTGQLWIWGGKCAEQGSQSLTDFASSISSNLALAGGYFSPGEQDASSPLTSCLGENFLNILSPTPKQFPTEFKVHQMSAGFGHILLLSDTGEVWSWGCNIYGQLGRGHQQNTDDVKSMQKIENLTGVVDLAAGYRHSIAVDSSGAVFVWGKNLEGELGLPQGQYSTPTKLTTISDALSVGAGFDYSLITTQQQQSYFVGDNKSGKFTEVKKAVNSAPTILTDSPLRQVSTGKNQIFYQK